MGSTRITGGAIQMNVKLSAPVIIAIVVLILIIGGEALILTSDHDDFSSSVTHDGDFVTVSVDANGSHQLNAVSMRGSYQTPDQIYIYYDESYKSVYEDVKVAVGARPLDQKNYVNMMVETLKVRDITDVTIVDAEKLAEIASNGGRDIAIVCLSGAFPDTVYDGTEDSKILDWISSGGRLYWAGNIIGKYIAHADSVETVENGTTLFFGSECVDDVETKAYTKHEYNGVTEALSIINNNVRYTPNTYYLPSYSEYLEFGYTDGDRYSSIVVANGEGSICVVGGVYSDYQRIDMAQIIAAGISPYTEVVDSYEGAANGKKTITLKEGETVYVSLGGDLTVYGKLHEVD